MRKMLIFGLFFGVLAVPGAAEAAYRSGGWCLVYSVGRGAVSENCRFRNFEACQAERPFFGSSGFCRVSQYPAEVQPRRLTKKKHKSRNY